MALRFEKNQNSPKPKNGTAPGAGDPPEADASALIDLHVLAEKVYELLKQELRLERERLGR